MKKAKMIYGVGEQIFIQDKIKGFYDFISSIYLLDVYFKAVPTAKKTDVLEIFEYYFLKSITDFARVETDEAIIELHSKEYLLETFINLPTPTYVSEYINVIGQLFLDGMIDFLCDCDNDYKRIDYPTNLSYFGNSKYEAWKHFRDNFFYKNAFRKTDEEDIIDKNGYSTIYSSTSWDKPQDWSQYNILVARTPKGEKYFNEVLAPKFYEKYKDIEITLDDEGNII